MYRLILISMLSVISLLHAQQVTYSDDEVSMVQFVRDASFHCKKFNSKELYEETMDSCMRFLKKYPSSFAKPNIYTFMFYMSCEFSDDTTLINRLADSILYYDKLSATKLSVAKEFVNRSINISKASELVAEVLHDVSDKKNKVKALLLDSATKRIQGENDLALKSIRKAFRVDSTNYDVLINYIAMLKMLEKQEELEKIEKKYLSLKKDDYQEYQNNSTISPNIGKNIYGLSTVDLYGNKVRLSDFKGEVIIINIFGFWCGWCIKEFPTLIKTAKNFPDIQMIFISDLYYSLEEIKSKFLPIKEFQFLAGEELLFSNYSEIIEKEGVPVTLVIDKNGEIRFNYSGYEENLEMLLASNIKLLLGRK